MAGVAQIAVAGSFDGLNVSIFRMTNANYCSLLASTIELAGRLKRQIVVFP